ncbi:MAG TPA: DUF3488 and transglutaminase-like domain-containing protein [Nocardioidaceae bacterium]|nr:DUF3488 and transglutaminase-like domain-containing protein [Nocardioidaceae bacterium]
MRRPHLDWSGVLAPSALSALTTWVALWSWAGFVQSPSGYLIPTLFAVLLVAGVGALMRAAGTHTLLVLVGQLVVLVVWTTHRWAPEEALGGWLPTGSSLRQVLTVLGDAAAAAQSYAAPVSDSVPQIFPLLIVTGALIAVLVDFLACGLRRVPVAGLPLLALYTAPVSILAGGVPWWVFATGAVSFLSLLVSEEARRLSHWGRQVPRGRGFMDSGDPAVGTGSINSSARKIGLTATGLAVVAPLLVPTLGGGFLDGNGAGGSGDGESVTISNPLVNLRRDLVRGRDVDLVRITTADANPSYLRISVLDSFDGLAWKPSKRDIPPEHRANGVLPRPPGLSTRVPRREVDYKIEVDDAFDSTWLPTPYPVSAIDVPGDWRYDSDTFDFISAVDGAGTAGLDYSLTALRVTPRAQDLVDAASPPRSVYTRYTKLPDGMSDMVPQLARQVTAGVDNRFEKAVRLQQWFREDGDFTYSLKRAPGTGADDLQAFLSAAPGGRVGYCEQFAAAMAVMGRTLGIPSRVAVGFLRPKKVGPDEYVYSAHDLHAWPEMYFDGVGWVRFEPTPDDRASGVPAYTTAAFREPEPTRLPSASATSSDVEKAQNKRRQPDAAAADAGGGGSGGRGAWILALTGLVGVALLASPRLARTAVRRRRWAAAVTAPEAAEAGWEELRDIALDLRLPWDDSVTLRTRARSLALAFGRPGAAEREGYVRGGVRGPGANPVAASALERLVNDVELARFARGVSGRGAREIEADVETCAIAMRAGSTKKRRRLAIWLPASLVRNSTLRLLRRGRPVSGVALVDSGVDRAV